MSEMPVSATDYWSALHERDDLSTVGQSGLSPDVNRWLYRTLARNLRAFLGRHGLIRRPPATVFEVGAGTGYWVDTWRSIGAERIDGCDLVPAAVDRLQARYGSSGSFVVADITDRATLPETRYDLVTCPNVLLHVIEDAPFERALENIAGLVAPGGHLLLIEPILADASFARPYDPEATSRARPLPAYAGPLEAAGLTSVDMRAAVVLANNPIEASSKTALARYRSWWRFVVRRSRSPRTARLVGPLVAIADRLGMATGAAPSSKFALFRRPPAGGS